MPEVIIEEKIPSKLEKNLVKMKEARRLWCITKARRCDSSLYLMELLLRINSSDRAIADNFPKSRINSLDHIITEQVP